MLQQTDPGQVEGVLRGYDAEEIGESLLGEHRVGIGVRKLEDTYKEGNRTTEHIHDEQEVDVFKGLTVTF